MRNYILVFREKVCTGAYAIDFESDANPRKQVLIALDHPPLDAATSFLNDGALLEYKVQKKSLFDVRSFSKNTFSPAEEDYFEAISLPTTIGEGPSKWGNKPREIVKLALQHDIEHGLVLKMYQEFASLSDAHMERMVADLPFISPIEKNQKLKELQKLRLGVRSLLETEPSLAFPVQAAVRCDLCPL